MDQSSMGLCNREYFREYDWHYRASDDKGLLYRLYFIGILIGF